MISSPQVSGTGSGILRGERARAFSPIVQLNHESGSLHLHKRPQIENYLDRGTQPQPPIDRPHTPHQDGVRYTRKESSDYYKVEDNAHFSPVFNLVANTSTSSLTNPSSISNSHVNVARRKTDLPWDTIPSSPLVKKSLPLVITTTATSTTSSRSCNAELRLAYIDAQRYHPASTHSTNNTMYTNSRGSVFRSPSLHNPPTHENSQHASPGPRELCISPTMSKNVTNGPSGGLQFIHASHESPSEGPIESASKTPYSNRFASAALVSQYNNRQGAWEQSMDGTVSRNGSKAESTICDEIVGWKITRSPLRSNSRPSSPTNPTLHASHVTNGRGKFVSMGVDENYEVGPNLNVTLVPSRRISNFTGGEFSLQGISRSESKTIRCGNDTVEHPSCLLVNDTGGAGTLFRNFEAIEEEIPDGYYNFGIPSSRNGGLAASDDNLHGSSSCLDDEAALMLLDNTKGSGKYNKSRPGTSGIFCRKNRRPEFSRLKDSNPVASSNLESSSLALLALTTTTDAEDKKDDFVFLTNSDVKKGGKKVARLASFFSNMVPAKGASDVRSGLPSNALRRPIASAKDKEEPTLTKQRREAEEMPEMSIEEHRFASAPRERLSRAPSSPSKSFISLASSGYVGWPGTLDKTGELVKMAPSFSESESSSRRSLEKTSGEVVTKAAHREAAMFGVAEECSQSDERDGLNTATTERKSHEWQNGRPLALDRIQDRAASSTPPAIDVTQAEDFRILSHADSRNVSGSPTPLCSSKAYESSSQNDNFVLFCSPSPHTNTGRASPISNCHHHPPPPLPLGLAHCVSLRHSTAANVKSDCKPSVLSPRNNSNGDGGQSGHLKSSGERTRRKCGSGVKDDVCPKILFTASPWELNEDINRMIRNDSPSSQLFPTDPWDANNSSIYQSSRSSKTSRDFDQKELKKPLVDTSGSVYRVHSAGTRLARNCNDKDLPSLPISSASPQTTRIEPPSLPPTSPIPLSEAALKLNDHLSSPSRNFNTMTIKEYWGLIEKAKDVPNLMDDESDNGTTATTSIFSCADKTIHSGYEGTRSRTRTGGDSESDVFDGLSSVVEHSSIYLGKSPRNPSPFRTSIIEEASENPTKTDLVVSSSNVLNIHKTGSLATIQAAPENFAVRSPPHSFDAVSTESDALLVFDDGMKFSHEYMTSHADSIVGELSIVANGLNLGHSENTNSNNDHFKLQSLSPWPARDSGGTDTFLRSPQLANSDADLSALFVSQSGTNGFGVKQQPPLNLSCYYVQPHCARKLIRFFRKRCQLSKEHGVDPDSVEDAKKSFALFEMRSRIMETDIERGLERRGGSVPVDDLVLTPYNQAACRVRDAVIVSKAWRDGASPKDAITASLLTRRAFKAYYVKRYTRIRFRPGGAPGATDIYSGRRTTNSSADSICSSADFSSGSGCISVQYTFEEVRWTDDTEFALLRCPSLGPRCLRGFDMFTIGDCQSLLLKLTNEHCVQLRSELNAAAARQLLAEGLLKDEADFELLADNEDMTDAETTYLSAMEEVRTISKQLVLAEKAFLFMREKIERLIARYESILIQIDDDEFTTASLDSTSSDDNDNHSTYDSEEEDREKELLARRAQRAELRAEVAAREAAFAKQEVEKTKKETEKIKEEKQRQLDDLQRKLDELESKSASYVAFSQYNNTSDAQSFLHSAASKKGHHVKVADIKAKFRSRRAEKASANRETETNSAKLVASGNKGYSGRFKNRASGEEMHQHIDFYQRSLKAVNKYEQ